MENNRFKVIIVEDVKLELKGTEEIFRHEIPNAEVIGTAMTENEFWELLKVQLPIWFYWTWAWGIDYHRCGNLFFFTEELSGYEGADFYW